MWFEWALAIAIVAASVALLPAIWRGSKSSARKGGGSGIVVAIGIAFSMIFDPKSVQATEQIDRQKDIGDSESGESGEKPRAAP